MTYNTNAETTKLQKKKKNLAGNCFILKEAFKCIALVKISFWCALFTGLRLHANIEGILVMVHLSVIAIYNILLSLACSILLESSSYTATDDHHENYQS